VRVADSRQPRILFATGLPPQYYLPLTDVRLDLLRPSGTTSQCRYKGTATYWSCGDLNDIAWTYRASLPENHKIIGLVCFYDERVDVILDGGHQERPCTLPLRSGVAGALPELPVRDGLRAAQRIARRVSGTCPGEPADRANCAAASGVPAAASGSSSSGRCGPRAGHRPCRAPS
jgi:uncharacterized protein (DUF427 family)